MKLNNNYLIFIILISLISLFIALFKNNIFYTFEGMQSRRRRRKQKNKYCSNIIFEYIFFIWAYLKGHASPEYGIKKHFRTNNTKKLPSYARSKEPSVRILLILKNQKDKATCFSDKYLTKIRYARYAKRYAKYKNRKK